jgi:hypothetical protein
MDAAGKDGAIRLVMSGVNPQGDKENARLIVSQIMLDNFGELRMTYPIASAKRSHELQYIRKGLAK